MSRPESDAKSTLREKFDGVLRRDPRPFAEDGDPRPFAEDGPART